MKLELVVGLYRSKKKDREFMLDKIFTDNDNLQIYSIFCYI